MKGIESDLSSRLVLRALILKMKANAQKDEQEFDLIKCSAKNQACEAEEAHIQL